MIEPIAVTPRIVDLILAGIFVEFVILYGLLLRTGQGRWAPPLALFLGSGAALFGALRLKLAGAPGAPAALLLGLVLHALCLASVWRRRDGGP